MSNILDNVGSVNIMWYNLPMQVKEHYHHGALKETLLAEALHELETEGLEGVSLRKVAEAVGVSKSAPYRHFADKRGGGAARTGSRAGKEPLPCKDRSGRCPA